DARLGSKLCFARQEGNMMIERIRRFWFPSVAILLASVAFLAAIQAVGLRPHFMMKGELPLVIYLPWLVVLPFLGAGGAYWARCQRGGQTVASAIGFLPVLKFLGSFVAVFVASLLVALPVCVALGALTADAEFFIVLAGAILSWVVIPGVALLLGVLPFLRTRGAERRIAGWRPVVPDERLDWHKEALRKLETVRRRTRRRFSRACRLPRRFMWRRARARP